MKEGIKIDEDLVLCYGDHSGKLKLQEVIAEKFNASADDVIVTVEACMALFIAYSVLLEAGDHLIVM